MFNKIAYASTNERIKFKFPKSFNRQQNSTYKKYSIQKKRSTYKMHRTYEKHSMYKKAINLQKAFNTRKSFNLAFNSLKTLKHHKVFQGYWAIIIDNILRNDTFWRDNFPIILSRCKENLIHLLCHMKDLVTLITFWQITYRKITLIRPLYISPRI